MSGYLMISLNSQIFQSLEPSVITDLNNYKMTIVLASHPESSNQNGWKSVLNNFRLIIQPTLSFWLVFPWSYLFPNPNLLLGFGNLIHTRNQFQSFPLSE